MRGEDVREPPPGQYEPITDPEEELSMQTINIPAESLRCGDEILSNIGLSWAVRAAAVRGRNVYVTTHAARDIRYSRADRVTVRRPA